MKNNVAGAFGGNRQSKSFGSSSDFADRREYRAGDDITKIDWNVYARTEQLYQKLYLDERQMHIKIYIDASRSMDYGGGEKAQMAVKLAFVPDTNLSCESKMVNEIKKSTCPHGAYILIKEKIINISTYK